MLNRMSRGQLAGVWCAAVIVLGALGVAAGAAITIGNGEWWLGTCLVPPAIMLLVWRGPPPITVAELLHSVSSVQKDGRQ